MLTYGNFNISDLGDVTISQSREYEGGDSPQRVKVVFSVKVDSFQDSFGDNYSLVQQLRTALQVQHQVLLWSNDDTNETYIQAPAVVQSNDLPEDPNGWGTFYQSCHLVFVYYEHNLTTGNLPLLVKRTGDTQNLTLTNVSEWKETKVIDRWSPLHSQRKTVMVKIAAKGMILTDPTLSLDEQRAALVTAKESLEELDGIDCTMVFGDFFTGTVRVDEFEVEINQAINQLNYSFTAHYTELPDESGYAMVEFQVSQRDNFTGELFLDVSGKITASDESTARSRLTDLTTAVLQQYQFNAAQPTKQETNAAQISPAGEDDPDFFSELSFSLSYRQWRSDNADATFQKTGAASPVNLQNIRLWVVDYNGRRFNELRSQRQYAGGKIEAAGTILADMTIPIDQRRTALMAGVTALIAAVNGADGVLKRGTLFTQTVRAEAFKAEINQAINGIDWTLSATFTNFPNENSYGTAEFTVAQRDAVDDGEQYLTFGGRIWAPTEALARAKLTSIRTTILATYVFTMAQQTREESNASSVFANGDKTATITGEAADGTTFTELTWTEEYRHRKAGLLNWSMKQAVRDDISSGLRQTTYSGVVQATGATPDIAYNAAVTQAIALAGNKITEIGGNAFLRQSTLSQDTRQTRSDNATEFVRLEFSYEYQSKLGAGQAYMEVSMELVSDAFGPDMENVSGYVVATDFPTAEDNYASIRSLYNGQLVRGERTNESQVQAQNATGFTVQQMRLDFSFQVFRPKAAGKVSYKYGITVSKGFLALQLNTRIHGSIYADSLATAKTALATLSLASYGSFTRDEQDQDLEFTSDSSSFFIKLDFDQEFTAALTGVAELLEMTLVEEVNYSGERWVTQPTLKNPDGTGGFSIPQSVSIQEGHRTIRGSVTAATATTAQAWAKKQRALLTGDKNGGNFPQPEQWSTTPEFLPRIEAVYTGSGANARIYKVEFTFGEILPNYPAP